MSSISKRAGTARTMSVRSAGEMSSWPRLAGGDFLKSAVHFSSTLVARFHPTRWPFTKILDSQVADAPYWKELASTILRPSGHNDALAAHRAPFEQRYCTPRFTGPTPWICTWKCALRVWPQPPRFSNQMLRYQRMPAGLVHETGLPAHRAMPDAYVTAHHPRHVERNFD